MAPKSPVELEVISGQYGTWWFNDIRHHSEKVIPFSFEDFKIIEKNTQRSGIWSPASHL